LVIKIDYFDEKCQNMDPILEIWIERQNMEKYGKY
jgi:hypothetical protein